MRRRWKNETGWPEGALDAEALPDIPPEAALPVAETTPLARFSEAERVWRSGDFAVVDMEDDEAFAHLDRIGLRRVRGLLENGNLPVQVARACGVPASSLMAWLEERMTDDERNAMWRLLAEALQEKSLLALLAEVKNGGHAMLAKALSDRLSQIAAGVDPDRWKARPVDRDDAPPAVSIQIVGLDVGVRRS